MNRHFAEGIFIFVMMVALFMILALMTYTPLDPAFTHVSHSVRVQNAGGQVGAYLAAGLYFILGYMAYLLPVGFAFFTGLVLRDKHHGVSNKVASSLWLIKSVGFFLFLLGGCGFLSLEISAGTSLAHFSSGGAVGRWAAVFLSRAFNPLGACMILLAMILSGITWLTGLSWIHVLERLGSLTLMLFRGLTHVLQLIYGKILEEPTVPASSVKLERRVSARSLKPPKSKARAVLSCAPEPGEGELPNLGKMTGKMAQAPRVKVGNGLPLLDLLEKRPAGKPMAGYTHQQLETISKELERHLLDFGVQADVVAVHPGPVITRFELQLAAGIKVSKLSALSVDLARSLSVKSVRVVEVIPGKAVVGLELPNEQRAMVSLLDILSSEVYQQARSPLTLALGVDIAGHPMVVDLAKMPHLLVAGTTGSGKSVGINAMILSLLFKATPEEVRLIMIDPKMLELSVYDGIPHLLTPVVTDMKEAASALRWCVGEMERRYRLMSMMGVRNLAGFNTKVTEAEAAAEPLRDPTWKKTDSTLTEAPFLQTLPYVVVIIDELADMMMVVGKKVEQLIARIAQKARAAGIHLVLATQRPSVDVLTGLIKSNIPTRISFQVSSKIDSRTILDQQGAEQLLGHGDMLFLAPGTGAPLRVHGAFVEDKEVHRIVEDWRAKGVPEYIDDITAMIGEDREGGEEGSSSGEQDALYDQAVEFVLQTRKASISSIQRRFKIGYNRSACLVESMEQAGLVGPLEGSSREVLVTSKVEEV